jgi:type II secretory pathway pseudopilin PulG
MPPRHSRNAGFTYLGILFAIAMLGIVMAVTGSLYSMQKARALEQDLLWIGHQYRQAIASYYRYSPQGQRAYPKSLDELLADQRSGEIRHHLRRLYPDPMTGQVDWETESTPDGGIVGVYSRSQRRPIKRSGFDADDAFFENSECYCDWRFLYLPALVQARPAPAPSDALR